MLDWEGERPPARTKPSARRPKNIIAARLRQIRREKQVTQVDLSALLAAYGVHITQASISKIEAGERPVYDYEVKAIAEALVVNAGWLLDVEEL